MNRIAAVTLLGLLAAALSSCSSPQMSRIEKNRDTYESWPLDVQQAVLDGKVEAGMTPEMVRVAWGKPTEVVGDGSIGDEIWVYRSGGSDGTMMYPGGAYPGGSYPGGYYPGGMGSGNGVGIVTGSGGTGIVSSSNVGIGMSGSGIGVSGPSIGLGNSGIGATGGMGGMGGMGGSPVYIPPTPGEEKEVVFRNGVVYRADVP